MALLAVFGFRRYIFLSDLFWRRCEDKRAISWRSLGRNSETLSRLIRGKISSGRHKPSWKFQPESEFWSYGGNAGSLERNAPHSLFVRRKITGAPLRQKRHTHADLSKYLNWPTGEIRSYFSFIFALSHYLFSFISVVDRLSRSRVPPPSSD